MSATYTVVHRDHRAGGLTVKVLSARVFPELRSTLVAHHVLAVPAFHHTHKCVPGVRIASPWSAHSKRGYVVVPQAQRMAVLLLRTKSDSRAAMSTHIIPTEKHVLVMASQQNSVRTRDEHFMDDFFFNMDTTRSSLSPARASGRSANGSRKDDRKSIENGVGKSSVNRLPNQRYSTSIKGSDNATRGSNDKHSNNHASGSKTSSMVLSPRHRRRRAQSNFDDDESSREEDGHGHGTLTLDEASYWLRSAGLPSGNAGGSNKMHERRTTSGGSITAEDSWSGGMGRGGYYDDDTPSTSHFGSSGRSNSASRPSRRYLVEQNRLRQGW